MRCLFCGGTRQDPLTFHTLLSAEIGPGFCRTCRNKLAPIGADDRCTYCGRDLRLLEKSYSSGTVCSDCARWIESGRNGLFGRNRSIYTYNAWMKEMMTVLKFRGDALLAEGFKEEMRSEYRKMQGAGRGSLWNRLKKVGRPLPEDRYQIVPVPLSKERLRERGFNQAALLAELLAEPLTHALIRRGSEQKQSKKSRRERLMPRENPFLPDAETAAALSGRKVLLIDDIYTTGATLRLAAEALEAAGPLRIDALTLAHG